MSGRLKPDGFVERVADAALRRRDIGVLTKEEFLWQVARLPSSMRCCCRSLRLRSHDHRVTPRSLAAFQPRSRWGPAMNSARSAARSTRRPSGTSRRRRIRSWSTSAPSHGSPPRTSASSSGRRRPLPALLRAAGQPQAASSLGSVAVAAGSASSSARTVHPDQQSRRRGATKIESRCTRR